MAQPQNMYLNQKPTFCAEDKSRDALKAEEYLHRVEATFLAAWGDDRKIKECVAGFQGAAHTWYYTTELVGHGREHTRRMKGEWEFFKERFKMAFFKQREAVDTSFNWTSMRQQQGETVYAYMQNLLGAIVTNLGLSLEELKTARPGELHATEQPAGFNAFHNALTPGQQATYLASGQAWYDAGAIDMMQKVAQLAASRVAQNGATLDKCRDAIANGLRNGSSFDDICSAARAVEERIRGTGAYSRQQRVVAEVYDDDDDEGVAAVRFKKNKQKGKPQQQQPQQQPKKDKTKKTKRCFVCKGQNHLAKQCPNKEAFAEWQRKVGAAAIDPEDDGSASENY